MARWRPKVLGRPSTKGWAALSFWLKR